MQVKRCIALGPLAAAAAWIVIAASWLVNRDWFVFTEHAFSDLGGPDARSPWLYNLGLIAVGLAIVAYGACQTLLYRGRPGVLGAGYMALAGVFLALIGVFPSGTRPHTFVSTWFFIQIDLALILLAWATARLGGKLSKPALALALAAWPLAGLVEALVGWPSAAVLEAYGILVIDAVVAALTLDQVKLARQGKLPETIDAPQSPTGNHIEK